MCRYLCAGNYKQPFRSSEVVSDKKENLFYYTETDDTGNFLLLLAVLGYGLFFAFQKPVTHPVTESEILQFIAYFGAIVVTIFFWGILANTLSMLFRNMWMGIGSCLLIWVATNSTGGDKLFGAWNLFSYSFRDIENTADITWLYGKGLCICIGLILLLALPKIVRKRG